MATATKHGRVVPQGRVKPAAGSFSSQGDAEDAARFVCEGASSARLGPRLPAGDRIAAVR
jgi:hypothetical protein